MRALAMVGYDGNVFWPPIVKFKGACEIKIQYFPFDDQVRVERRNSIHTQLTYMRLCLNCCSGSWGFVYKLFR